MRRCYGSRSMAGAPIHGRSVAGGRARRALAGLAVAALCACAPAAASAETLEVTSLANAGPGSLRQRIVEAHEGDTIVVPAGTIR